jgi:glycosyltransferase involved in cell wall biosynthesis
MITAVIPAYNEADRIPAVIGETAEFVDEVLVVDDASTDGTSEAARTAGARVVRQPDNRGYLPAIKRGFREANGDIVVTVDADGEMPVERIPDLVRPIRRGEADMVQGARPEIPRPSEKFLTAFAGLFGPVGDSGTGFRALRTELARSLQLPGACICGIVALEVLDRGGKIEEVPIELRSINEPRGIAWFHVRQAIELVKFVAQVKLGVGPQQGHQLASLLLPSFSRRGCSSSP